MLWRTCTLAGKRIGRVQNLSRSTVRRWYHLQDDVLGDLEARGLIAQVTRCVLCFWFIPFKPQSLHIYLAQRNYKK